MVSSSTKFNDKGFWLLYVTIIINISLGFAASNDKGIQGFFNGYFQGNYTNSLDRNVGNESTITITGETAARYIESSDLLPEYSYLRGSASVNQQNRMLAIKWAPILNQKKGGYCLEPKGRKAQDGALLVVRPCDSSNSQLWQYTGTTKKAGVIKSHLNKNKCIEAKNNKVRIESCNESVDQKWLYKEKVVYSKGSGNKKAWKWLSNTNGNPLSLTDKKSKFNEQKWIFSQLSETGKEEDGEESLETDPKAKTSAGGGANQAGNEAGNSARTLWTDAHNSRRKKYHMKFGKDYVPVKWSTSLADEAQNYADKLARSCKFEHYRNGYGGENLACNWKSGDINDGDSPDEVLKRWTEDEEELDWFENGHFTQVLWRSTKYIGCAEGVNLSCNRCTHYHVCRYLEPGNCNVSDNGSDWKRQMLKDSTGCTPRCPFEGCF